MGGLSQGQWRLEEDRELVLENKGGKGERETQVERDRDRQVGRDLEKSRHRQRKEEDRQAHLQLSTPFFQIKTTRLAQATHQLSLNVFRSLEMQDPNN